MTQVQTKIQNFIHGERVDASDGYWHRHFAAEVERLWSKGRVWQVSPR